MIIGSDRLKKNIWFFNHYAYPPRIPGGTRHFDFAKELEKRGYNVTIFTSSFVHRSFYNMIEDDRSYKVEMIDDVRFVWIKTPPYKKNDFNRVKNILAFACRVFLVTKNFNKPDIILGSTPDLFTALSAYFAAKRYKAKFISEIRDLWPQTFVDAGDFSKYNILIQILYFIEKMIYKVSDKIVTLLPGSEKYIKERGVESDKIINIPNGINVESFLNRQNNNSNNEIIKKAISENKGKFTLLYAGAHGSAQALDNILKAAKLIQEKGIKDISFILIGEGPAKEKLIDLAANLNLKNLYFYDGVPKSEIPILMDNIDVNIFNLKRADVFKYGVSANKLFDYLCSAKPMIFACETEKAIIEKSNSGLIVPPEKPERLAQAILRLYNMDASKRKEIGQRGLEYVKKFHSIDHLVDKYEGIFKEII